jgi:transposase-like protein
VFQKAKATVGPAQEPSFVVTDKLQAYRRAFNKEFYVNEKNGPLHVRLKNIRQGTNNNIVERLHGTVRERTKVMRGLDNEESASRMIEGQRLYYNYLRPHMALNGKTPAEVAGLDMKLEQNKWQSLIAKAAKQRR